jgi:dipeptidyl aminopeptidase/acylaminoacyl peptidase
MKEEKVTVVAQVDPQFDTLTLAPSQSIQWKTSTGYSVEGLLLLPPDYVEGKKYPLVIGTKPTTGEFVCDTGETHFPSFAPQPLANAGILYLMRYARGDESVQDMVDHFPKGFPGRQGIGGIAEAAFQMDIWDSAIRLLDRRGLIDSDRVGIIGFSRSGWYTEFALTHSSTSYRAATVTDNVEYSLGEYWLSHSIDRARGWEAMYGGPPYGLSLTNWIDYSISFNLDKLHTPLLMETMGHGVPYSAGDRTVPLGLAMHFEIFTGLNRLNKPVELYYYPYEDHQPDHPRARLASLQRNLDWYRFWLQDYENPQADPSQYQRWRRLRGMQYLDGERRGNAMRK